MQDMPTTPISGIERYYWFSTKAENAYLLPEENRVFEIGRASKTGAGTGFGQQNYWYAESNYAKENIIPAVLKFIENNRDKRINTLNNVFEQPEDLSPLSKEEWDYVQELGDEGNDIEYLPYAYRMYAEEPSADNAYQIAVSLKNLFQYKMSIPWYEKTEDTTDIYKVEQILDEDHYGLEKIKERILEYLAVKTVTNSFTIFDR